MTHKLDWDGPVASWGQSGTAVFIEYDLDATLSGEDAEFTVGKEYKFLEYEPESDMNWEGAYVIDDNGEEFWVRFSSPHGRHFKVKSVDNDNSI